MPFSSIVSIVNIWGASVFFASGAADSSTETKGLEALSSLSQALNSMALLVIGGSILVLLTRGYFRPLSRWGRAIYLTFLVGWFSLGLSIWRGIRAQSVLPAYYINHSKELERVKFEHTMQQDFSDQITFLLSGLSCFAVWLFVYLLWWWYSESDLQELTSGSSGAQTSKGRRHGTKPLGVFAVLILLPINVTAADKCDCLHMTSYHSDCNCPGDPNETLSNYGQVISKDGTARTLKLQLLNDPSPTILKTDENTYYSVGDENKAIDSKRFWGNLTTGTCLGVSYKHLHNDGYLVENVRIIPKPTTKASKTLCDQ